MTKSSTKLSQRSVIYIYVKEMFQDSNISLMNMMFKEATNVHKTNVLV